MKPSFSDLLQKHWPELPEKAQRKVVSFRERLLKANEAQNLTRITEEREFVDRNILDVKALLEAKVLSGPAVDLGSGGGVPGLLSACVEEREWVLVESESRKAEFLSQTAKELDLPHVRVVHSRIESCLDQIPEGSTVVARAVGKVGQLSGWIESCSTWNTLVLLKGPTWDFEWNEFQKRTKSPPVIERDLRYRSMDGEIERRVIALARKP